MVFLICLKTVMISMESVTVKSAQQGPELFSTKAVCFFLKSDPCGCSQYHLIRTKNLKCQAFPNTDVINMCLSIAEIAFLDKLISSTHDPRKGMSNNHYTLTVSLLQC